jgi:hypothetical protein
MLPRAYDELAMIPILYAPTIWSSFIYSSIMVMYKCLNEFLFCACKWHGDQSLGVL